MSVINKVLRDLDRQGPAHADAAPSAPGAVTRGTQSVAAPSASAPRPVGRVRRLLVPGALLLVALLALGWAGRRVATPAPPVAPATPTPDAVGAAAPRAAPPLPEASVQAPTAAPALVQAPAPDGASAVAAGARPAAPPAAAGAAATSAASGGKLVGQAAAPVAAPVAAAAAPAASAGRVLAAPSPVADAPAPVAPAAAARAQPAGATADAPPAAAWPDAALAALGQAQRSWNGGARSAAVELLRDALAGVARSHGAEVARSPAGAAAVLAMVRELARMELVLGQHAELLALLRRHEPWWSGQADLWALRAQAAQHLGEHGEAGQAYLAALRLRPGEPRWMLGAAVSLAALGQLQPAADLATQARALGPVPADVAAYLRQLGVPWRE